MPFIVWDTHAASWVADVDTFDGETSDTPHRDHARIFKGSTWREFFSGARFNMVDYQETI